jgi:hypothetical protein
MNPDIARVNRRGLFQRLGGILGAATLGRTGAGEPALGPALSAAIPARIMQASWAPALVPGLGNRAIKKVIDRTPLPAPADSNREQPIPIPDVELIYFDPAAFIAIPEENSHP